MLLQQQKSSVVSLIFYPSVDGKEAHFKIGASRSPHSDKATIAAFGSFFGHKPQDEQHDDDVDKCYLRKRPLLRQSRRVAKFVHFFVHFYGIHLRFRSACQSQHHNVVFFVSIGKLLFLNVPIFLVYAKKEQCLNQLITNLLHIQLLKWHLKLCFSDSHTFQLRFDEHDHCRTRDCQLRPSCGLHCVIELRLETRKRPLFNYRIHFDHSWYVYFEFCYCCLVYLVNVFHET